MHSSGERALNANRLIRALPRSIVTRWARELELIDMPMDMVLQEQGEVSRYVYFPTTAMVSLTYLMQNNTSCEIAVVGNEGMIGIALLLGGGSTSSRAVVHSGGAGLRMASDAFRKECDRSTAVLQILLRFTQALITQMAQTAVCNRLHRLDQQMSRWLLLSLDRRHGTELLMTQGLLAAMLGVRRETVTEAALKLQRGGVIRYSRGRIQVLDRAALERTSCECYGVVKREEYRLLLEQPRFEFEEDQEQIERFPLATAR
jgi:CRP-like cAMP-binding protein